MHRVDAGHLDLEQLLDRVLDVELVGVLVHDNLVTIRLLGLRRALFGHAHGFDD